VSGLVIALLYLGGLVFWLLFYTWGNQQPDQLFCSVGPESAWAEPSLRGFDWYKEEHYYQILGQALHEGRLPYHYDKTYHLTDRFLAMPETNLSPQVLLLLVLPPMRALQFNTLLLYSLGTVGCLFLRSRYGLGLIPYAWLFVLFQFNGYIVAHLSVG